jgi:uridine nucleosidase
MIPLNVTHTAIVTKHIRSQLLSPNASPAGDVLAESSSALRRTISELITFFAETYKATFGFDDGPPLHDALTIAYVCQPQLLDCQRHRVDVETHGTLTFGETVVDTQYNASNESWGLRGKNCLVAKSLNVITNFKPYISFYRRCKDRSQVSSISFESALPSATAHHH